MGLVYEAERIEGEPKTVAIKVLSPAFAEDPDFVERFRREADALLKLRHPHLIEVYEKDEHRPEGGPTAYYFVMERFDGVDLRRYVEQGRPSVDTVLAIVRQAAAGLAFAHQHGIVHRDIKPGNILVRGDPAKDGLVKVVDFGVAQLASPEHTLTSLTRSDLILGTYNYMSPEQRVDASRIDRRADVYALGVVAYELLTGSLPLGAFEPPSELRPDLPKAADRALLAALRRDPGQRPSTVAEFAEALGAAIRPPRRRGWALGVAAAALLGASAVGYLALGPEDGAGKGEKLQATKAAAVAPPQTEAEDAPRETSKQAGLQKAPEPGAPPEDLDTIAEMMKADVEAALSVHRRARAAAEKTPKKRLKSKPGSKPEPTKSKTPLPKSSVKASFEPKKL